MATGFLTSGDGDGAAVGPAADSIGPPDVVGDGVGEGFVTEVLFAEPEPKHELETATLAARNVDIINDLIMIFTSIRIV